MKETTPTAPKQGSGLDIEHLLQTLSDSDKANLLNALSRSTESSPPSGFQVEYLPLLGAFQGKLKEQIYSASLKMSDLTAPLGYAERSSIARLFRRTGMPLSDVVKIMAFAKIAKVHAADPSGGYFKISTNAKTIAEAAEVVAAMDKSDPRPEGLTWEKISHDMGYSSRTGARLDRREETQVVWFIQFSRLYGVWQFEASTPSGVFLKIEVA